ncbi:MAG TPA: hypothetical protein VIY69_03795, partial [Candidatus Acidoferrales bacterium]
MEINRREFIVLSTGVTIANSLPAAEQSQPDANTPADSQWHQRVRRIGQTNMTEHDPAVLNIEEWADYWSSLK